MIPPLSEALAERGFDTLTPVQEAVTAPDVGAADLLVSAQTGSGKTVGFGLAIAPTLLGPEERFGPAGTPLALVVAPTRELAFQVMTELRWLYAKTGAIVNACVGGMDIRQERRLLERGTHIVVGTPGRLCDHIRRGALDLSDARAVVLDEADEMLDLGFREDLEFILNEAPAERRTLLFSATVSPVIARIADEFQRDAKRINTIDKAQQHSDIAYQALKVAQSDSDHAIFNLLRFHDGESAIVFANTRAQVTHLTTRLANRGLPVVSLSGELSQTERSHALQAMRDGRARVCVATDVAARGIDLPNLNLVIHADLPTNTESLLHRSGRTGRAGRKGISALIVPPRAVKKAERLLKWAKIRAEWTLPPSAEEITQQDEDRLLNDPAWSEPLSEEQRAFAARVLELHGPEAVAAALLRLHHARHSAPEELQSPDTPARREPREFGPSRWFSLSVGRNERAEPRWLLPMILRAADLNKDAVGAIRVQDDESFVEIAEAQVARMQAALGADGTLADNVRARLLDGVPEGAHRPARKPFAGGKKRFDDRGKPPRAEPPQASETPAHVAEPPADTPSEAPRKAAKVWSDKPAPKPAPRPEPEVTARADDAAEGRDRPKGKAWSGDRSGEGGKPYGKGKTWTKGKPAGDAKPWRKDKPSGEGKPAGAGKPWRKDKPAGEGNAAGEGKRWSKGKPAGDPADTSKRWTKGKPPADGKPGGKDKPRGKGKPGRDAEAGAGRKPGPGKGKPGAAPGRRAGPPRGGDAVPRRKPH